MNYFTSSDGCTWNEIGEEDYRDYLQMMTYYPAAWEGFRVAEVKTPVLNAC